MPGPTMAWSTNSGMTTDCLASDHESISASSAGVVERIGQHHLLEPPATGRLSASHCAVIGTAWRAGNAIAMAELVVQSADV